MSDLTFRFKEFSVEHSRSSMKVGVDGVLIGAWSSVEGESGLDIGCGCGLIALMVVQRNSRASVLGIDIDEESVEESARNFANSPWSGRLKAKWKDFGNFVFREENEAEFDFVVSNPPFFTSGVTDPKTPREKARHMSALSLAMLIKGSERLLAQGGTLSVILPYDKLKEIKAVKELALERLCFVANKPGAKFKRIMAQFRKGEANQLAEELLYIRDEKGNYSEKYKALTSDFYLNF